MLDLDEEGNCVDDDGSMGMCIEKRYCNPRPASGFAAPTTPTPTECCCQTDPDSPEDSQTGAIRDDGGCIAGGYIGSCVTDSYCAEPSTTVVGPATVSTSIPKCEETDSGEDFNDYGETTGVFKEPSPTFVGDPYRHGHDPITKKDYCVDSTRIVEFFCTTGGEFTYRNTLCPDGTSCVGGECRSITVKTDLAPVTVSIPKCEETDGGNVQGTYGETTGVFKEPSPTFVGDPYRHGHDPITKKDYCVDSTRLVEYYCTTGGEFTYFNAPCPSGKTCSSGACKTATIKTTPTMKTQPLTLK
jgi:hypothetical protein